MTAERNAPTIRETADLIAHLRRLQRLGAAADPADRDAVLATKWELLARIEATQ
jgi:hypothetical protein